jgi:hypothetical protein
MSKEFQIRMESVKSNAEREVLSGLKKEINDLIDKGKLPDARCAIEELFAIASTYQQYLLDGKNI